MVNKRYINQVPKEIREKYTDEFILLGILIYAKKYRYKLTRMQIMKILQKFKEYIQDNFEIQAYHNPLYKNTHGDFDATIYDKLTDLKTSDFINYTGSEPYEAYSATDFGEEVFNGIKMSSGAQNEKFTIIRKALDTIVKKEGIKDGRLLRAENHERKFIIEGKEISMDDLPIGTITTPNLDRGESFLFDNRLAIDWSVYREFAKRNREDVTPDENIPKSQEDIHRLLGLRSNDN